MIRETLTRRWWLTSQLVAGIAILIVGLAATEWVAAVIGAIVCAVSGRVLYNDYADRRWS